MQLRARTDVTFFLLKKKNEGRKKDEKKNERRKKINSESKISFAKIRVYIIQYYT